MHHSRPLDAVRGDLLGGLKDVLAARSRVTDLDPVDAVLGCREECLDRTRRAAAGNATDLTQRPLYPPFAALSEDGVDVALEEGASVLEVLLGVGLGGGDALERFVEDADGPLLLGEWRKHHRELRDVALVEMRSSRTIEPSLNDSLEVGAAQAMIEEFGKDEAPASNEKK